MSFLSRLGKGFGATLLTGSLTGGAAAAMTDNFGVGLGTGIASRMMNPFGFGGFGGMGMGFGGMGMGGMGMGGMGMGGMGMGGMGYGGMGMGYGGYGNSMGMGYSNFMYDMSYNNSFNTMANAAAWY